MNDKLNRLPSWLKKRGCLSENVHNVKARLRKHNLHTVCEEARCPNMGECFSRGTATIMIMGNVCTRRCGFCAVTSGEPIPLDPDEPMRVACQISEMKLKHAVVTSVTRDDLPDGGANHFLQTIRAIKTKSPETKVEVLTPDFEGREVAIKEVCMARPDIFNHNIETVERLTAIVRNKANYKRSIKVLACAKTFINNGLTKSGLMLGLGEEYEEVVGTLRDLREAGVDIVTIGQYLRPTKESLPIARYVEPDTFRELQNVGLNIGFNYVFSGPFVRSSYLADQVLL